MYLDFFLENQQQADELYNVMLKVCRKQFCGFVVNSLSLKEFKTWLLENFNLEKKGEKLPLVLVKAVGTRAEQKGDNLDLMCHVDNKILCILK